MKFELEETLKIIEATPETLYVLLHGLSRDWIYANEGEHTWSAFDVVGHLIVCEKTDFIPRTEIILSASDNKLFPLIDMTAQFELNKGKSIADLLQEFQQLRRENIKKLLAFELTENDFKKTGIHPKIGEVTLSELLAGWAAHDLNHLSQIARVMAKQYKHAMGPFMEFVSIVK